MIQPLKVEEFLLRVYQGEFGKLETYGHVERLTDSFRPDKLMFLLEDIDSMIHARTMEIVSDTRSLVPLILEGYKERGIDVPYKADIVSGEMKIDEESLLKVTIVSSLFCLDELRKLVISLLPNSSDLNPASLDTPSNVSRSGLGIELFLNDEGLKCLHTLKALYKRPDNIGDYVGMVNALADLGLLSTKPSDIGVTSLHRALVATFGEENAGTRANIEYHYKQADTIKGKERAKAQKIRISSALTNPEGATS